MWTILKRRERDRQTGTETDRQTDRQTDRDSQGCKCWRNDFSLLGKKTHAFIRKRKEKEKKKSIFQVSVYLTSHHHFLSSKTAVILNNN